MTPPIDNAADWSRQPERSNMLLLRLMTWISLRCGRGAGRVLLHPVAAYFLLFAPASRAASRDYLARVLQRPARWRDIYRHFHAFASTIHDRVYLLNQRFDLFDITVHGDELIREAIAGGKGVFLVGAHMGSFEVMRAIGRRHTGLKIAMAMYEENARRINQTLAAINPAAQQDIIGLGRIDSMLKLNEFLDAGAMVGMLADRTFGNDATQAMDLLGSQANMPLGPFRMAAILRRPVLFMTGLYLGGNRYEIHFEKLADFSRIARGERPAAVSQAALAYVALLDKFCRRAPFNWFNFFDFWSAARTTQRN